MSAPLSAPAVLLTGRQAVPDPRPMSIARSPPWSSSRRSAPRSSRRAGSSPFGPAEPDLGLRSLHVLRRGTAAGARDDEPRLARQGIRLAVDDARRHVHEVTGVPLRGA